MKKRWLTVISLIAVVLVFILALTTTAGAAILVEGSHLSVDDSFIYGVPKGVSGAELKQNFSDEVTGVEDDEIVVTGTTIVVGDKTLQVVVLGDVNGDDRITSSDYVTIKRIIKGNKQVDEVFLKAADASGDGRLSSADYLKVKRAIGGYDLYAGMNIVPDIIESTDPTFAPDVVAIKVKDVKASAGETVKIPVIISNNPGVAGAKITISYDSALELVSASSGEAFNGLYYTKPGAYTSPCGFTWDSESEVASDDGTILYLEFKVSEDAKKGDKYNIGCTYREGDVYDADLNDISLEVIGGSITIN